MKTRATIAAGLCLQLLGTSLLLLVSDLVAACTRPAPTLSPSPLSTPALADTPVPPPSHPVAHDGRTLLFVRDDDLWRMRPDGSGEERLSQEGALSDAYDPYSWSVVYRRLVVSPDGRWIAWTDDGRTWLLDMATRAERIVGEDFAILDWAPDSHALAYTIIRERGEPEEREWALHLYDPYTAHDEYLVGQTGRADAKRLLWSPDSRAIAYSCCTEATEPYTGTSRSEIYVLDLATRQVEAAGEMEQRVASATYLCWTADGRVVSGWPESAVEGCARCSPDLDSRWTSPDGTLRVQPYPYAWEQPSQPGCRITLHALDQGPTPVPLWEREFPDLSLSRAFWSLNGEYLFLDDHEPQSPIWRLRADGTGKLEEIAEDGFLIEVVGAWR